jgi:hypothetical protein
MKKVALLSLFSELSDIIRKKDDGDELMNGGFIWKWKKSTFCLKWEQNFTTIQQFVSTLSDFTTSFQS